MTDNNPLLGLATELEHLSAAAAARAKLSGPDLRRVLAFTAKVAQVVDQAFQDVLTVLIEIKYLTHNDLDSGRVRDVQKQVELLTVRSRYRDAEEICSRLHHLGEQFQNQIVPLIQGIPDADSWEGVFGLINEHEGRVIMLVRRTIDELEQQLRNVDQDSLPSVVQYAAQRAQNVREGVDQLRELSNRILGLSGEDGLLELTGVGGVQAVESAFLINKGPLYMTRDSYNVGQAGAVGPGSKAQNMTFQQIWQQNSGALDLAALASELAQLRSAMRSEATDAEHDQALGAVAAAEAAAKNGDGPKTLEQLKSAGRWALDIATKIGVSVASAALKTSLSL